MASSSQLPSTDDVGMFIPKDMWRELATKIDDIQDLYNFKISYEELKNDDTILGPYSENMAGNIHHMTVKKALRTKPWGPKTDPIFHPINMKVAERYGYYPLVELFMKKLAADQTIFDTAVNEALIVDVEENRIDRVRYYDRVAPKSINYELMLVLARKFGHAELQAFLDNRFKQVGPQGPYQMITTPN